MHSFSRNSVIVTILVTVLLGVGLFVFMGSRYKAPETPPTVASKNLGPMRKIIGRSVEGRGIESFTYGNGPMNLAFVGGVHGGYEWNSVLLSYEFMDYLETNPAVIPKNLTVIVIPSANPDGVYKVTGKDGRFTESDVSTDKTILASGRFNANGVDLNRNFNCKWQSKSTWQTKVVSAGTGAFSEPEAKAVQSFVLKHTPVAVIFWHSKANAVYASECEKGILPETLNIMYAYSKASGYTAVKSFDGYEVTGDAEGWLASINTPAITVELKTHEAIEWERNLAGIKALFEHYGQK